MKMNKEQFLKTEFGGELESTITAYEAVINELKEQLLKAGKVIEASDARRGELEKELTSTKEKLEEASKYAEEADKKIATLEAELSGTKEQLEAALKKNKAAEKK